MARRFRQRVTKVENLLSAAVQKKRQEEEEEIYEVFLSLARMHATNLAAILLSGRPRVNEPLNKAWIRTLEHYNISLDNPMSGHDQRTAAVRLSPMIIGYRPELWRFGEIFSTVPGWFVEFTALFFDRALLRFDMPGAAQMLKWGTAGFEQAQTSWPLLPSGKMTDGDPISGREVQLWPFSPDATEQANTTLAVENDPEQKDDFTYAANGGLRRIALELMKNPQKENVRRRLSDFYHEIMSREQEVRKAHASASGGDLSVRSR